MPTDTAHRPVCFAALLCVALFGSLSSACYSSHLEDPRPVVPAPDSGVFEGDRFGIWAFSSCTGSGIFVMFAICEDGSAQVQAGNLGSPIDPRTAGWTALDGDRIEVLGARGGRWTLRWSAADGRWRAEDPIDECAEAGFEPLEDGRDLLDRYASAMGCAEP